MMPQILTALGLRGRLPNSQDEHRPALSNSKYALPIATQPARPLTGDEDGDASQPHLGLPLIGPSSCHLSARAACAGGFPALHKLLLQSAALQYWCILSQIDAAVRSEDHVEVMGLNAAGAALKSVFSDGSRTEAVWLTHRLLWALPWAARHVPPSAVAARALEQILIALC
jgi:hypothetical protein